MTRSLTRRAYAFHSARALLLPLLTSFAIAATAHAEPRIGCPMFHCNEEATSVMYQPIVTNKAPGMIQNNSLGVLKGQGCSSDGKIHACIFTEDDAPAAYAGNLKVLDGVTLNPVWGSASPNVKSYNPNPAGYSIGEVPYILPNGQIIAGDSTYEAIYDGATGNLLTNSLVTNPLLPLNADNGKNFGITHLVINDASADEANDYAVVTQGSGVFTLIKISTWTQVGPALTITGDNETVSIASPSSASGDTLYAVSGNNQSKHGYLHAIKFDTAARKLVLTGTFAYAGKTGASPVVVKPSISKLDHNLILLHVPGFLNEPLGDKLVGLEDTGAGFRLYWPAPIALTDALDVTPVIDENTSSLFFQYTKGSSIYNYDYLTGKEKNPPFSIQAATGFTAPFKLNGHMAAVQGNGTFGILLSGNVKARNDPAAGQYSLVFQPFVNGGKSAPWIQRTLPKGELYTEAWGISPTATPGIYCPSVIGTTSGLTVLCPSGPDAK